MANVRLIGLEKRFGRTTILHPLTLTVEDGEFFALVGPSGCGKSTLLHLLAGLEAPTAGAIWFGGQDVTSVPPGERDVALVFQSYALYPHLTAAENLAFPLRVRKRALNVTNRMIEHEVHRMAEMLGLEACLNRKPAELSGGQRQRVALGRALIRKPRVFLMDEPLSNLDAQLRASMRAELRRLHDELKITTIYVTHDQTEAMTLGDRLAILHQGRIQQIGAPGTLYEHPSTRFVAEFIGYPPMNMLDATVENHRLRSRVLNLQAPAKADGATLEEGRNIMVGIRPEHIRILPKAAAETMVTSSSTLEGGVLRLLEHSGGQIWGTVEIGIAGDRTTVVGYVPEHTCLRSGDDVVLTIMEGPLHMFDPVTGQAL